MSLAAVLPVESEVAGRLLYLLALLAAGVGARAVGLLDETRTERLNSVAFYVALPALVFTSVYGQPLGSLLSPALVVGLWLVLFGTAAVAWYVHRYFSPDGRRGVAVVQSYHTNVGYLGLPLVALTFGEQTTAVASLVLGVVAVTQLPLTVLLLVRVNDGDVDIREEVGQLARNPVLVALLLGMVASTLSAPVPPTAAAGLGALSELALPVALLCVGASLPMDVASVDLGATGAIVALKLAWMPALAWVVFSALGVSAQTFVAGVVMLAMPTAVSTFVYAGELGGDDQFASVNIFVTTVASLGSLFVLLQVL
jgi:malonate transporter